MQRRCYNKECKDYLGYGAKGIRLCDEWQDINKFMEWSLRTGYARGLTIERKDNASNYCPQNCTWVPMALQGKNTSRNYFLTFNGKTLNMSDWAKATGINYRTLVMRKTLGWPIERMLTLPPDKGRNKHS